MQYGNVPGVDKPISRIVQGTVMLSTEKQEQFNVLLDAALAAGINCFDTATIYGGGGCERTLGAWMEARGNREQVVILDKGAHHNADRRRVTPYDIGADVLDALARLRTDYVDLFVLHRDDENVPVGPIVEALNEHKAAGRIRAFGGSNWSHRRIAEANEYADRHGLTPMAVSSPNLSLAPQIEEPWDECVSVSGDEQALAFYRETQMPLFSWSSLAGGFFSGRFTRENFEQFRDGEYFEQLVVRCYCSEENFQRLDRARRLAERKDVTVAQVAVAYVLSLPINCFALVAAYSPEEAAANAAAADLTLTPDEITWLELTSDTP
jgi:aryl-alcohol dehydrogenase-like predicted oxidoreductase